jgi:uncharacterized protein (DUF2235 family)
LLSVEKVYFFSGGKFMAKTLAAALEQAGLIDPKKAKRQDRQERVEEGRRIKKLQPLQDRNGIPVIAENEDFFRNK